MYGNRCIQLEFNIQTNGSFKRKSSLKDVDRTMKSVHTDRIIIHMASLTKFSDKYTEKLQIKQKLLKVNLIYSYGFSKFSDKYTLRNRKTSNKTETVESQLNFSLLSIKQALIFSGKGVDISSQKPTCLFNCCCLANAAAPTELSALSPTPWSCPLLLLVPGWPLL